MADQARADSGACATAATASLQVRAGPAAAIGIRRSSRYSGRGGEAAAPRRAAPGASRGTLRITYRRRARIQRWKFADHRRCQRRRLARALVQQHRHRSRRGDAVRLRKTPPDRSCTEVRPSLRHAEPHFDRARPAQFGAEMDVEPHHDPGRPRRHQPVAAVLHQRDAAGLEIGRIDRVVDVLVGIEVGKPHIVRQAVGEISRRGRVGTQGAFTGRSPKLSRPYSPVVEMPARGRGRRAAILWLSSLPPGWLDRRAPRPPGSTEKKRS